MDNGRLWLWFGYQRDHSQSVKKNKGVRLSGTRGLGNAPKRGDYVYTDGVPEATNASNELFGTERMIHALNVRPNAESMKVLKNMRNAVDGFVLDAEQFDDLTMLCLEYKGTNSKKKE